MLQKRLGNYLDIEHRHLKSTDTATKRVRHKESSGADGAVKLSLIDLVSSNRERD